MPNGIDLILADHQRVAELFERVAADRSAVAIGEAIDALAAHDQAEHAALYPMFGALVDDVDVVSRAEAAHSAIKKQIEHIMALEGEPLMDGFARLRELVERHVADEERGILPALGTAATSVELDALGARILQAKQRVG